MERDTLLIEELPHRGAEYVVVGVEHRPGSDFHHVVALRRMLSVFTGRASEDAEWR